MTMSATIPVTVNPDAAAHIAELGFQAEMDRMIDRNRSAFFLKTGAADGGSSC